MRPIRNCSVSVGQPSVRQALQTILPSLRLNRTLLKVAFLVCLVLLLHLPLVYGQTPRAGAARTHLVTITAKGCLGKEDDYFLTTGDDAEHAYRLIGHSSELDKFKENQPLIVVGTKDADEVRAIDSYGLPGPVDLHIISVKPYKVPVPILKSSFTDAANWTARTNSEYGIKFSLPRNSIELDQQYEYTNLVSDDDSVRVAADNTPSPFPTANGGDTDYVIRATSNISNRESCEQFNNYNGRQSSLKTVNGIRYAVLVGGGAAGPQLESDYYFHTFQNGVCYEIAVTLHEGEVGIVDGDCVVPLITGQDEDDVADTFVRRVTFIKPTVVIPEPKAETAPKVMSFAASSDVASDPTQSITFSWQSTGADYVKFSYFCSDLGIGHVGIIEGENVPRNCSNSNGPESDNPATFPANSAHDVSLASYGDEDPRSVVVTLIPFSHGRPYPDGSRSITITVSPYNQFQKGISTGQR